MLKLIIGGKATSTWSMRPWLVLKRANIPFEEIEINQRLPTFKHDILQYSPTKKVPVLWDNDLIIWDSLAIAEYIAETYPHLWPHDKETRAIARSVTAEMHSGFLPLRRNLPMEIDQKNLSYETSEDIENDITRITTIWEENRKKYAQKGPFLFGDWSIADAFFTPVAIRFTSYQVRLSKDASDYAHTLLNTPEAKEWIKGVQHT